jgi:hypothetical protein
LPVLAKAETDERKSSLAYEIRKVEKDPQLKMGEASFIFCFDALNQGNDLKALYKPYDLRDQAIEFSYNGISKKLQTDKEGKCELILKPGKYVCMFFYNSGYGEITTDSISAPEGMSTTVVVHFRSSATQVIAFKPVIYLYPEKKTKVNVKLDVKDLTFTYPAYNNGWKCTVNPDGSMEVGTKTVPYLFWEGRLDLGEEQKGMLTGFVVEGKNIVAFLEEKLTKMGLNEKESADFITYWAPKMAEQKYCVVRFLFNEEFGKHAPLTIEPHPETIFRVFMLWCPAPDDLEIPMIFVPQHIPSFARKGFTVVEWGGTETNMEQPK